MPGELAEAEQEPSISQHALGPSIGGSRDFTQTEAYTSLSPRSREDYRDALERLADLKTELVDARTGENGRVGDLSVSSLSPAAVDKLYAMLRKGAAPSARPTIQSTSPAALGR